MERSVSVELDNVNRPISSYTVSDNHQSDLESAAGSNLPGKPGRKKNPKYVIPTWSFLIKHAYVLYSSSQAARRDQNRIAQREFRLRKQQRARPIYKFHIYLSHLWNRSVTSKLELKSSPEVLTRPSASSRACSKVCLLLASLGPCSRCLSPSTDEDLMDENQTLRNLLRSLATFIGDGAGGLLPKLGWDLSDFNSFINRSETDTAWQGYQRRKKTQTETGGSGSQPPQAQKRTSEDDQANARSKKARGNEHDIDGGQNGYPSLLGMNPPPHSGNSLYSASARPSEGAGMFNDMIRGNNGSPMFMQPSPSTNSPAPYGGPSPSNFQPSYMSPVNMNIESTLPPLPFPSSGPPPAQQRTQPAAQMSPEQLEDDEDPNKNEAYKLIQYAMPFIV